VRKLKKLIIAIAMAGQRRALRGRSVWSSRAWAKIAITTTRRAARERPWTGTAAVSTNTPESQRG